MALKPDTQYDFVIDGQAVEMDDLTFQEQQEYRALVRESSGDPELNPRFAEPMDRFPALVFLLRRRANPDYTIEDARSGTYEEFLVEKPKRPTRAAAAGSQKAA